MSMNTENDNQENIVIAGLGVAGARLVHLLLSSKLDHTKYNIVVVSPRPFQINYIATARLVVSDTDNLKERAFIPVEQILRGRGTFVQSTVTQIQESKEGDGGAVTLENGERIPYRILVLATGASWDGPLSFPNTSEEVSEYVAKSWRAFEKAQSIVLIGAGAVGSEIAGEIKDIWPGKQVTLVHGGSLPFSDAYPDHFRRAVESGLRARDVDFVFGDYVDEMPLEGATEVQTRNGRILKADLVLSTRGQRFNTGFIATSLGSAVLGKRGLVKIEPTLQVKGHKDIFAIGDIIEWDEQKQAAKAGKHAELVAKNIIGWLSGTDLRHYKGQMELIVVTNGKDSGVGFLGMLWGIVLGGWFARLVKSRNLFVERSRALVGAL